MRANDEYNIVDGGLLDVGGGEGFRCTVIYLKGARGNEGLSPRLV